VGTGIIDPLSIKLIGMVGRELFAVSGGASAMWQLI
jgi:hypothetical protein